MAKQQNGKKGCRKMGRTKRKAEGRVKPLSQFVRNKITAEAYFKLTGQRARG